jgi:hypothetical protein
VIQGCYISEMFLSSLFFINNQSLINFDGVQLNNGKTRWILSDHYILGYESMLIITLMPSRCAAVLKAWL